MSLTTDKPFAVEGGRVELRCPHNLCDCPETHVVDLRWETDIHEGDRKHVRMEVRCEMGHGYILFIANHAGNSYFRWELISDVCSPFASSGEETNC
jgi:hypothetical protein